MSNSTKAYIFLVITTLGWSANSVVGKFSVGHVGPLTLTLARWCVALAVILAISIPQLKADWPKLRSNWLLLFAYGAIGFTAFNAMLYSALRHTSAINVVIEQAAIPGLIFVGNYILFRIKLGVGQIVGYAITLTGVAITASNGSLQTLLHLDLNIGDLMMLIACIVYAIYTIGLRYKPDVHWKSLMAASALGALVASIPLFAWEIAAPTFAAPDAIGWMVILFTGLVPSLVSQILYVRGVELIGPNRASLFINTIPVFGTLLAVVFLREALQGFHFLALALVITGIAIAERGRL
jgi:drug/metabolite transporter (DMT)-like permease